MFGLGRKVRADGTHGSSLLEELEGFIESHTQRAVERADAVRARLTELESESAKLKELLWRLEGAQTGPTSGKNNVAVGGGPDGSYVRKNK